jgi:hypothetical protein
MKKVQTVLVAAILAIALLSSCSSSGIGGATELLGTLGKLGVTPDQAIGGLGSIMSLAQGKLNPEDFTKVSKSIPGLDNIMKDATNMGAITGPITSMAGVEQSFSKLGMNKDMVGKFVPEITKFATQSGGAEVGNLLSGVLK